MATQSDYGYMLDNSIRSFVSKEEMLTDVDIRGIKDHRPREMMENPNSFALLFQENYKCNNKNPRGRVFDYRFGGQNSRFNRLQKEKKLQYQKFRRRVELEKKRLKKGDKKDDGDDSDNDKNDKKIQHFKTNIDGSIDTLPQAPLSSFLNLYPMWWTSTQEQVDETPQRMEGGVVLNDFYKDMENAVNKNKINNDFTISKQRIQDGVPHPDKNE